jgi:hypothetical protein
MEAARNRAFSSTAPKTEPAGGLTMASGDLPVFFCANLI